MERVRRGDGNAALGLCGLVLLVRPENGADESARLRILRRGLRVSAAAAVKFRLPQRRPEASHNDAVPGGLPGTSICEWLAAHPIRPPKAHKMSGIDACYG